MPGATTQITTREKAAIFALAAGILPDWKTAYICADQKTEKEVLAIAGLVTMISRWRHSTKVQTYLEYCRRFISDREHDARERGKDELRNGINIENEVKDSERAENETKNKVIDYSDPTARKTLYNQIIRRATDDPKTQLDAAKVLEQIQRDDRQAASEQRQVRAYLPLLCHDCPLYQNEKNKQY